MESLPCWQKIWKTVTSCRNVMQSKIAEVLDVTKDMILEGIAQYPPYTPESFEKWKSVCASKNYSNLERLVQQLSEKINLNSCSAWGVFCNFLMFDYYGKIEDINRIANYGIHLQGLIKGVYEFYQLERMYSLKIIRHLLEHYQDPKHKYQNEYKNYVDSITLKKIRSKLIKQFELLLKEINVNTIDNCISLQEWVCRNNQEQLEVLFCIVLTMRGGDFEMNDYIDLLKLFKYHNYTRQPIIYEIRSKIPNELFECVQNTEVGVFLVGLKSCLSDVTRHRENYLQIEEALMKVFNSGDASPNLIICFCYSAVCCLYSSDKVEEQNILYGNMRVMFKKGVAKELHKLVSNKLFKGSVIGAVIRDSVFAILDLLCFLYNENHIQVLLFQEDIIELFADLLHDLPLANACLVDTTNNNIKNLSLAVMHTFPVFFYEFTQIFKAISSFPEHTKSAVNILLHIPMYVREFIGDYSPPDGEILLKPYIISTNINTIVIPVGTSIKLTEKFGKHWLIFFHEITYFQVFEQKIAILLQTGEGDASFDDLMKCVISGYQMVCTILSILNKTEISPINLYNCMRSLDPLLKKFGSPNHFHLPLLKVCFEIVTVVVTHEWVENVDEFKSLNFLPRLKTQSISKMGNFDDAYLSEALLLNCIQKEKSQKIPSYEILHNYFMLTKYLLYKKKHYDEVILPATVYIIYHVFPDHFRWSYQSANERWKITAECLSICEIMIAQNPHNNPKANDYDKEIFNFCLNAFLNNGFILETLVNCFSITNETFRKYMLNESNWENGMTATLYDLEKILFGFLLMLLKYNKMEMAKGNQTLLDSWLMHNTPKCLKVVKCITTYINNNFLVSLPKLACLLLKEFAARDNLPLLSLLSLDHYQIQCVFLEKLRDPLANSAIKINILKLISVCVEYQYGMMAAFFSIDCSLKNWETQTKSISTPHDTMIDVFSDYMKNMRENVNYLQHPVQVEILEVMNKLWECNKYDFISSLISTEDFWEVLTKPLFAELNLSCRIYSLIFHIIAMEIFYTKPNVNERLVKIINKFFDGGKSYHIVWNDYLVNTSKMATSSDVYDNFNKVISKDELYLMESWKQFVMMTGKIIPECFNSMDVKSNLMWKSLEGLSFHLNVPKDFRIINLFADLYLFFIIAWPEPRNLKTIKKVLDILNVSVHFFKSFTSHSKETLLAIISETVKDSKDYINSSPTQFDKLLIPLAVICEYEYDDLDLDKKVDSTEKHYKIPQHLKNWVLILTIANNLLTYEEYVHHTLWFTSVHYLDKLMVSTGSFMQKHETLAVGKISLHSLILYAQSSLVYDFLRVDLLLFYDHIKPPSIYMKYGDLKDQCLIPQYLKEWWIVYSEIMKFLIVLVNKLGNFIKDACIAFVYSHDKILKEIFTLMHYTADERALDLIKLCLTYILIIMKWKNQWQYENRNSYLRTMASIRVCLNACINIILRPNLLMFFINKNKNAVYVKHEKVPETVYVNIMNKVLQIITLCCKCFSFTLPDITELFDICSYKECECLDIQFDFQVPKIDNLQPPDMHTYGSFLCLLYFLCKTSKVSENNSRKLGDELQIASTTDLENKTEKDLEYNVIIRPDLIGQSFSEKLHSVVRFALSDNSSLSEPWLNKLDTDNIKYTLEMLLKFLSVQLYLISQSVYLMPEVKRYFRREMSSELHFFYERAKKNVREKCKMKYSDLETRSGFLNFINSLGGTSFKELTDSFHEEYMLFISYWFMDACLLNQ